MAATENLDYLVWPRLAVHVEGPKSHGVDLVTAQEHRVGGHGAVFSGDPEFDPGLHTCVGIVIDLLDFASPGGATKALAVVMTKSGAGTVEPIGVTTNRTSKHARRFRIRHNASGNL